MLATVHPKSSLALSLPKDISPGLSVCLLASIAPSSLSLAKGVMLSQNCSGSTHSVYCVPWELLMVVL